MISLPFSTPLAVALYITIWFTVLFAVLPFGIRSQAEAGEAVPGSDPVAPVAPRLARADVEFPSVMRTAENLAAGRVSEFSGRICFYSPPELSSAQFGSHVRAVVA